MEEEEKYFDYTLEPGKVIKKELAMNDGEPLISIITGYYNGKKYINQTAYSILNQTFPYWEWIIIDDGSTQEGTKETLENLEKLDSRIKIYHQENKGRIVTRDEAIKKANTEFIFVLDADDLIDPTLLECAYWTMQTNPEASWAYCDFINFDGKQFLWKKEFSSDIERKENILSATALIKKEAILEVGGYNVVDKDVHEDWHLWLRLLEKGHYPIRMDFYGFWYRQKKEGGTLASINSDKKRDQHAREVIKKQARKIINQVGAIQFPTTTEPDYNTYPYTFSWNRKPINEKGVKKHLLFIFPWFHVGGADKFNYDLISKLDLEKYTITIVTTEPSDYIWRQRFEKYAEIFDLTTFLHRKDWSAFIYYLMKSRNIDLVVQSNSFYGYYVLPWLKAEFPEVIMTDYIHCENWGWRNGEYPRESTALSRILDKTYTCTSYVGNLMLEKMERTNKNLETVYIGVDADEFDPEKVDLDKYPEITKYKEKYTGKKILLYLARVVEEKRPIFLIYVLKQLCEKRDDILLFVVGNGPELHDMKKMVQKFGLEEHVIFFGMQKDARPFYKLATLHIIASLTEGLTLTTYESLAMKTPVVTADVGGQKELVDATCGRVVTNIQNAKEHFRDRNYQQKEIERYAKAVTSIIDNPDYDKMADNARKKVQNGFSIQNMTDKFNQEFEELIQKGTVVDKKVVVENKELYKQYLVLFNQVDKRIYHIPEGGVGINGNDHTTRLYQFRETMWRNPIWRGLIRFLQKIGVMKVIKKSGIDQVIKRKL